MLQLSLTDDYGLVCSLTSFYSPKWTRLPLARYGINIGANDTSCPSSFFSTPKSSYEKEMQFCSFDQPTNRMIEGLRDRHTGAHTWIRRSSDWPAVILEPDGILCLDESEVTVSDLATTWCKLTWWESEDEELLAKSVVAAVGTPPSAKTLAVAAFSLGNISLSYSKLWYS